MRLPFRQTPAEIGLDARGGLVTVLGGLGEELHHNGRERPRDACDPLVGRHRLPGDMAVHPLHRIGSRERQRPRKHLVEGDTQSIEVAAGVHRAVHPASLFRRHVGERPGDHLRRRGGLMLARQTRGTAEPRQPHAAARRVHQDICRLDVLMDKASLMHSAERPREWDRDAQEMRYLQWPAKQAIERHTAGILKHQRHAVVVVRQRDWSRRPVGVKFGFERIFVFEPLDATGRRFFCGNNQDRRQAVAGAAVESDVSLPQRREHVARELVHGGLGRTTRSLGYVCSGPSNPKTDAKNAIRFVPPETDIASGPVSCAVAYKSPQSPTSSILRQSAFCMKTGAEEFVLATNARRTHELTAQRIGAKVPQDGPRR
jgi:hypothetical protein